MKFFLLRKLLFEYRRDFKIILFPQSAMIQFKLQSNKYILDDVLYERLVAEKYPNIFLVEQFIVIDLYYKTIDNLIIVIKLLWIKS